MFRELLCEFKSDTLEAPVTTANRFCIPFCMIAPYKRWRLRPAVPPQVEIRESYVLRHRRTSLSF